MLRLVHSNRCRKLASSSSSTAFAARMGSKFFSKPTTTPSSLLIPPIPSLFSSSRAGRRFYQVVCSKPISKSNSRSLYSNGHATVPVPPPVSVDMSNDVSWKKGDVLRQRLAECGIEMDVMEPGQYSGLYCPKCEGGDSGEKSFSIVISPDGYALLLHFCELIPVFCICNYQNVTNSPSRISVQKNHKKIKREITEESLQLKPLCNELIGYFKEREISRKTLLRNGVMQKAYENQIVIAFTYRKNGNLVSCKYRDINKKFWQEKDTEKIFYGLDDIKGVDDIIIVEGEIDKLAMEEAGFRNCVSVPDGAPPLVSSKDVPPESQDTKYQYLWNCKEYLKKASRIILATDGDPPGQALAEELARRLGRERCWRVKWPKKTGDSYCKDANEVLMYLGPQALKDALDDAELYPIKGLFHFKDFFDEIDSYYHQTQGYHFGVSTGWKALDGLYSILPGELTIVSGVPNSGKSEWIDALLCNINRTADWKFALCSMENKVRDHARKLMEKHLRKPFFDAPYGQSAERISVEEYEQGKQWLNDTFYLIRCEDDALPSIRWVLTLAKAAVLRHGVRGLVIDPYNELDHQRPPNMTETEYVSQMLTLVKRFAQHHSCHVWFVAHPRQLHNWVGGPPNMYDISGSAHFINKCDNGIIVHRNRNPDAGEIDQVQICVRKVRNKVVGTIGEGYLTYNRVTGEYLDMEDDRGQR
ncbi:Twinkle homolog protein, chloroplastic/mitochondrial [Linum perenne]